MDPSVHETRELDVATLLALRDLMGLAFDDFDDLDWQHALGGRHVMVTVDGRPVSHAALVERPIDIAGRRFRAGYVEAVATAPAARGRGAAAAVMHRIGELVRRDFDLGVLCTGLDGFYERFGWERWSGPTAVRLSASVEPTPAEDGLIFVLRHGPSAGVDLISPISCDERTGDDW
jgi:aminoglycoside 2'-N-acetyltransferase I